MKRQQNEVSPEHLLDPGTRNRNRDDLSRATYRWQLFAPRPATGYSPAHEIAEVLCHLENAPLSLNLLAFFIESSHRAANNVAHGGEEMDDSRAWASG